MTNCVWCARQTVLCMHEKTDEEELALRFAKWMRQAHPDWIAADADEPLSSPPPSHPVWRNPKLAEASDANDD